MRLFVALAQIRDGEIAHQTSARLDLVTLTGCPLIQPIRLLCRPEHPADLRPGLLSASFQRQVVDRQLLRDVPVGRQPCIVSILFLVKLALLELKSADLAPARPCC